MLLPFFLLAGIAAVLAKLLSRLILPTAWGNSSSDHQKQLARMITTTAATTRTQHMDWDRQAQAVCTVYQHTKLYLAGSSTADLTPMPHEVLGLDVSAWPFVPLAGLIKGFGKQNHEATLAVLDAFEARAREAGIIWWAQEDFSGGDREHEHEHDGDDDAALTTITERDVNQRSQVLFVLSLAAELLLTPDWRNQYIREVVPVLNESVEKVRKRRGRSKQGQGQGQDLDEQAARSKALDQWCQAHKRFERKGKGKRDV